MRKSGFISTSLLAVLSGLVLLPSAVQADPSPVTDINAPTKIDLMVTGRVETPKPGKLSPEEYAAKDFRGQALQAAIEKAIKLNSDLNSKWGKCHFHIADLVQEAGGAMPSVMPQMMMPPPDAQGNHPQNGQTPPPPQMPTPSVTEMLRVTYLGDSGCLTAAK